MYWLGYKIIINNLSFFHPISLRMTAHFLPQCLRLADITLKSGAITRMVKSAHTDEDMCEKKNCVFVS